MGQVTLKISLYEILSATFLSCLAQSFQWNMYSGTPIIQTSDIRITNYPDRFEKVDFLTIELFYSVYNIVLSFRSIVISSKLLSYVQFACIYYQHISSFQTRPTANVVYVCLSGKGQIPINLNSWEFYYVVLKKFN